MIRVFAFCSACVFMFSGFASHASVADKPAPEYIVEQLPFNCDALVQASNLSEITAKRRSDDFIFAAPGNWLFTPKDFRSNYGFSNPKHLDAFARFLEYLKVYDIKLALAYVPNRGLAASKHIPTTFFPSGDLFDMEASFRRAIDQFQSLGVLAPDLIDLSRTEGFFLKRDFHWSVLGARTTAELLAKSMFEAGFLEKPDEKKYKLVYDGLGSFDASTVKDASERCGFSMRTKEYHKTYVAKREESGGDSANSLFGDDGGEKEDEIVLLGTSFSADSRGFSSYLTHALDHPISNFTLSGGQARGAWMDYLRGEFQKNKPAAIIWELPSHYDLDENIFPTLNPRVYDGCATVKKSRQVNNVKFNRSGQARSLLYKEKPLNLDKALYVIDLNFNTDTVIAANLVFWNTSGSRDEFRLDGSERTKPSTRLMAELNPIVSTSDLLAVDIDKIEFRNGTVVDGKTLDALRANISVCKAITPDKLARNVASK